MEKIGLLFPGQGSQYTGMGKSFYSKYPIVREVFEEAEDILGYDIKKLCFEGGMDQLTETKNAQATIFTVSVAMFRAYLEEYEKDPSYLAGHSLGEISALACSGAIKFSDGLNIVKRRGELMQETAASGLGGMIAVSEIDQIQVENIISQIQNPDIVVGVACYNSENQIVISGNRRGISEIEKVFMDMGAKTTTLKVSAPFHSILMSSVADKLEEELLKYDYYNFKWPVISNVNAKIYNRAGEKEEIIHHLKEQIVSPVLWSQTMDLLENEDIDVTVEIGPHSVLRNLMRRCKPNIESYALDKKVDQEIVYEKWSNKKHYQRIADKPIDFVKKCISITLCTKNYNDNEHKYSEDVIKPIKMMKQLINKLDEENRESKLDEKLHSLEMLIKVLHCKKVSHDEQKQRLSMLLRETHDPELKLKLDKIIKTAG